MPSQCEPVSGKRKPFRSDQVKPQIHQVPGKKVVCRLKVVVGGCSAAALRDCGCALLIRGSRGGQRRSLGFFRPPKSYLYGYLVGSLHFNFLGHSSDLWVLDQHKS